ncbi:3-oxoacyl-(acyl-carrier-protein) reductase [uncultured Eubacteriales bacterium]|uniref:3-oxoacyl-[acyl-carrier-protein] reductase n=1 Tax=uncultured Eubacteriales bacterium TaxID=172733 RepID=A0A212KAS9_9FIRM|nr:3-oxoacyl-(acyl-carrier-protein) reductase [uncultured Eubacteriales bacterium]
MEQTMRKVALVTGGSRGLGRAVAMELARGGANVALVYAGNEAAADNVVAEIEVLGCRAVAYRCDVSRFDQAKETVAAVLAEFGQVDILVNNAGITRDGLMLNMKEEQFDAVVDTNLKGAFNMTRHVYASMMKRRYGRIVNISSVVGLSGNAGQTNYASAKAGLIGLTKSVAKELAARGVTCNAVAPGFIETDMTNAMPAQAAEKIKAAIPLGRLGKPEDVAALVAFLVSDGAGYITGEVIKVDGGMYI